MAKIRHLNEYHKLALASKYKGVSYQDIAEMLNEQAQKSGVNRKFTEQTLKDWFRESGPLSEAYRLYETEMDDIHRETMEVIKKAGARIREENFKIANEMLIALMGSQNDNVKLGAIKELLDRVEGKPKEFLDVQKHNGVDLLKYENRLRAIRERQKRAVGKSA